MFMQLPSIEYDASTKITGPSLLLVNIHHSTQLSLRSAVKFNNYLLKSYRLSFLPGWHHALIEQSSPRLKKAWKLLLKRVLPTGLLYYLYKNMAFYFTK